jgi:hypothetical protein
MFVVRERLFNYSLLSLSDNEQVVVEWPLSDNQQTVVEWSLSDNEQIVVEWPLSDNEQTIVEWSLSDNEQIVVEWPLSDNEQTVVEWSPKRDHSTTVYVCCPRETIQLHSKFVFRERPFNYSLCSLSERDHSTTVYVRCAGETIQLNTLSRTTNIDCSSMVSLGKRTDCS